MRILKKYWWLILLIIIAVFVGGFYFWVIDALGPMPEAIAALESDEIVTVETEPWLVFTPTETMPTTGFIFYPGGKVDYRSYAPHIRDIAEEGYLVIVPEMPLNLAIFGINSANDIVTAYPDIEQWVIGGHSLGGSMAAKYVYDQPDAMDGIVLWASYPADNNSLTSITFPMSSIWGTEDGFVDKIIASDTLMSPDTIWVEIEGGNHAQFGWYGEQAGDNPATISREEQQAQTVEATVTLLEAVTN